MFLTSNCCLNMSLLSIIMLPQWKSCLVWIRREICTVQAPIINKNSSKQICGWITEEALLWNIDSYFVQKQQFEVKNTLMMNLFLTKLQLCLLKMLTDGLEWCGLLWCFYQMLDSHSDGTHSLQSIHCWASDAMLHFSKSDEETNSARSWRTFSVYFLFWMNYSFSFSAWVR